MTTVLNALLQTEVPIQLKFEDLQRGGDMVCVESAAAGGFRCVFAHCLLTFCS